MELFPNVRCFEPERMCCAMIMEAETMRSEMLNVDDKDKKRRTQTHLGGMLATYIATASVCSALPLPSGSTDKRVSLRACRGNATCINSLLHYTIRS